MGDKNRLPVNSCYVSCGDWRIIRCPTVIGYRIKRWVQHLGWTTVTRADIPEQIERSLCAALRIDYRRNDGQVR